MPLKDKVDYPTNDNSNTSWVVDYGFRSDKYPEIKSVSFSTNTQNGLSYSSTNSGIPVLVAPVTYKRDDIGNYVITTYGSAIGSTVNEDSKACGQANGKYSKTNTVHTLTTSNGMVLTQKDSPATKKEEFTGVLFMYYLDQIPHKTN